MPFKTCLQGLRLFSFPAACRLPLSGGIRYSAAHRGDTATPLKIGEEMPVF